MARRLPAYRRSRILLCHIVAWLFCTPFLRGQAQPGPASQPLTLEDAFARALAANPTVAAARLRRAIDLAGVGVARERPNPEGRVEIEKEAPKQSYSIAMPLEVGGQRRRRIAVSEAALQTGEAELARTIADIRGQVRHAYFTRAIGDARLAVLTEIQQLATRARAAAQQRFDAGGVPRLEVLQAQLALIRVDGDAAAAQAIARAATIRLNALLGLPLDAALSLATPIDVMTTIVPQAALERAQASSAELALLDRRIQEQRVRIALARALRKPDVTPEVTLTRDAEPEFTTGWRAAVAVVLPLFTTHRAGVLVEEATLAQLQAERGAAAARLTGDVSSAASLAEAQRLQYVRYRDQVLPQVLEVERMAEDSYRLGQTDIAALMQALQAARELRLQALQSASDLQDALGELERAIGAPFP